MWIYIVTCCWDIYNVTNVQRSNHALHTTLSSSQMAPLELLTNTPTKRGMKQTPLKPQSNFPSAAGKIAMQTSCQLECVKYKAVQCTSHIPLYSLHRGLVRSAAVSISFILIEQMVRSLTVYMHHNTIATACTCALMPPTYRSPVRPRAFSAPRRLQ